jgi:adenylyltransferase/sulfurtransferase
MSAAPASDRYSRQILFDRIGEDGQERLREACAVIVGCGALGSVSASILVRAGVGTVTLVDRDAVEASNLQRQFLYDERDLRELKPKALAARDHLAAANSEVRVRGVVADLSPDNAVEILKDATLIVDGTDNFETRFLINDVSVRHGIPWIYAACLGSYGVTMNILPGETACLRCLLEAPPDPGSTPTCDTAGIIAPAVSMIASFQSAEALKYLSGRRDDMSDALLSVDVWTHEVHRVEVPKGGGRRRCATCDGLEFEYLAGKGTRTTVMCGRNAVQVTPSERGRLDLGALATRLRSAGSVESSEYLVRFSAGGCAMTIFPDGRAIIAGTKDAAAARAMYAKFVGA